MRPYGIPRIVDLIWPDKVDIRRYGLNRHKIWSSVRKKGRRFWKKLARRLARQEIAVQQSEMDSNREEQQMSTSATESKPKLQLSGEDGNAFAIMGKASRAAKKAGWPQEKIDEYFAKAKSGDYDNLLQVTMTYFDVH